MSLRLASPKSRNRHLKLVKRLEQSNPCNQNQPNQLISGINKQNFQRQYAVRAHSFARPIANDPAKKSSCSLRDKL